MRIEVDRRGTVYRSYKSERARGLFNVTEKDGAEFHLTCDLPVEGTDWQVGVVVGSSGSGKSSIGQELIRQHGWKPWEKQWFGHRPILEEVGPGSFDHVTGVLSQVGLGSVPAWLRPYGVLSNGEKFRADMAALLLAEEPRVVIDEFTSVLDRTVAQIGAGAFVRAWRKKPGRQIILLTCHHDVLAWCEPDWVFNTDNKTLFLPEDNAVSGGEALVQYQSVGKLVIRK